MNKKLGLVLGMMLVLVLGSITTAYAAANSGYAVWNATSAANSGTAPTPHKEYLTTTVKCAVCHAVHKGNDNGELLLMGSAGESCVYCHIDDNIGLVRIYNGDEQYYTDPYPTAHNDFGAGAAVGSRCTDCHSIHGANSMDDASVEKFILKTQASASGAPGGYSTPQAEAAADQVVGDKQSQINAFCSMCHPYYQTSYNGTITVSAYHAGGTLADDYQSHVMTDAKANYGNTAATYTGKVAWLGSEDCRSCHDAGLTDQQAGYAIGVPGTVIQESYPHYTPSYTRFMVSKGYSTDTTANTSYTPSGGLTSNTMTDGVCLKCHRGTSATDGVGDDF